MRKLMHVYFLWVTAWESGDVHDTCLNCLEHDRPFHPGYNIPRFSSLLQGRLRRAHSRTPTAGLRDVHDTFCNCLEHGGVRHTPLFSVSSRGARDARTAGSFTASSSLASTLLMHGSSFVNAASDDVRILLTPVCGSRGRQALGQPGYQHTMVRQQKQAWPGSKSRQTSRSMSTESPGSRHVNRQVQTSDPVDTCVSNAAKEGFIKCKPEGHRCGREQEGQLLSLSADLGFKFE